MKFTGTLSIPRIDFTRYEKRLRREMSDQLGAAAFAWLDAVIPLIPVWSGASRATFLHLANEIEFNIDISPSPNAGKGGRANGLQNSSGGIIETGQDRGFFYFSYNTTLAHLIYNEFNNANITPDPGLRGFLLNPGPYNFQEKGRVAFFRVAADARLPNPFALLKIRPVKVG